MPEEPVRKFSGSALQVGHFKEDVPGYPPSLSANRKKDAKAYLMVKLFGASRPLTFFLWRDADGNPVNKRYIQMAEGLDIEDLKRDLMVMYNLREILIITNYNEEMKVARDRIALRKCELRGETYELPADQEEDDREIWFCSKKDPEMN
ncbi:hypothetical protein FPCIR_10997 [Fusarium pseudocircinatum]|uniref:Uncharacterized protein n=1 Tax=Fusarium pseudocircinatum TaxID=56676 RepID=A0A8H5KWC7_9HYPO|nr:hypothetical protein FPCIR_10997 [Fusarium pseudocircinatum]